MEISNRRTRARLDRGAHARPTASTRASASLTRSVASVIAPHGCRCGAVGTLWRNSTWCRPRSRLPTHVHARASGAYMGEGCTNLGRLGTPRSRYLRSLTATLSVSERPRASRAGAQHGGARPSVGPRRCRPRRCRPRRCRPRRCRPRRCRPRRCRPRRAQRCRRLRAQRSSGGTAPLRLELVHLRLHRGEVVAAREGLQKLHKGLGLREGAQCVLLELEKDLLSRSPQ